MLTFALFHQLCIHAQNGRKCQYVGNCSFAHSPEERDMWTFMKENKSEWGKHGPESLGRGKRAFGQ